MRRATNEISIYLNGVLDTSQSLSGFNSNNTGNFGNRKLFISGRNFTSNFFSGSIEEFRLYNRALSAQEVQALYENRGGIKLQTNEDTVHGFLYGDLIRAQRFTGVGTYRSDAIVTHTEGLNIFYVEPQSTDLPARDYDYVRIGSATDSSRRGAVYLTADDSGAPYIDVIDGVNSFASFNTMSTIKTRNGRLSGITSPIFGTLSGYGF